MAEPVSLDLLQSMVQRVLDGQNLHREDIRNIRRRLSRIEHWLASIESAAGPAGGFSNRSPRPSGVRVGERMIRGAQAVELPDQG